MGSSSHENIPTTKPTPVKDNANVVYTPASTVSSKADSAYEGEDTMASSEPVADNDNNDAASAGWREWWKAEELAAQVGSLSEKLTELKDVIITNRNTNPDVEANV
jgi:tryptophan 2,3-dioxygenase